MKKHEELKTKVETIAYICDIIEMRQADLKDEIAVLKERSKEDEREKDYYKERIEIISVQIKMLDAMYDLNLKEGLKK